MTKKSKAQPEPSTLREQAAKGLTDDERAFRDWMKQNDARLFCDDVPAAEVFAEVSQKFQGISLDQFHAVRDAFCKFWQQGVKLRPLSDAGELSGEQWDALRDAVEPLLPYMRRLNLSQCITLVRTKIKTNGAQLRGLPRRFHVWTNAAELRQQEADARQSRQFAGESP